MIAALDRFQEKNGLKVDGIVNPGGPTERAINNRLLGKPRGVGLMLDPPPAIGNTVGNGMKNAERDVTSVKRRLGALDYLPEDPFDRPPGFITEATSNAIKRFQVDHGLTPDGWLAPGGETERAIDAALSGIARVKFEDWLAFAKRVQEMRRGQETAPQPEGAADWPDESIEDGVTLARIRPPGPPPPPPSYRPPPAPTRPLPPTAPWPSPTRRFGPPSPAERAANSRTPPGRDQVPSANDVMRALGRSPMPTLDDEITRALPIPPPRTAPPIHTPEPGSPLRIPIIDFNPDGRPGKPETVQTTRDVMDAIQKECMEALRNTGASFEREEERYYRPRGEERGQRRGASYADGWVRINIGGIIVDFVADTYSPKLDGKPISAENDRYMKLEPNMGEQHGVVVRVPKAWKLGQEINKQKLSEATREICEQIKNMLKGGELDADKKKVFISKLLDNLVKPKRKRGPLPAEPTDVRP